MTNDFLFFCAVLSPFTPESEVLRLREVAARGEVGWAAVAGHANRACLAPALCVALESKGLLADVPEMFRDYLREMHRFNRARNEALLDELREVVRLLNDVGVTPLLLKGGAAVATDLFSDPGARFMWDLDLLVPQERLEESVAALLAGGYGVPDKYGNGRSGPTDWTTMHHVAPLIRPGAPAPVELHHRLLREKSGLLEPGAVWASSRLYTGSRLSGITAVMMSPTDELIYCFAHSELAHGRHYHEQADARYLQQLAYLVDRHREEIAWDRLETLRRHPRYGEIFSSYLYLARMLFRVELPWSADADPYAERHYRAVTTVRRGWEKRCHLLGKLARELVRVFSAERLWEVYGQDRVSIARLRLKHLAFLIGRYRRMDAWQERLRGMGPF